MEKLIWDDRLSVGILEIDHQHQKLIGFINILNDVIAGDLMEKTTIRIVLRKMVEYSQYHFQCEEDLMQKVNYPDMPSHKSEHSEFSDTVKNFIERMKENDDIAKDLLIFLYSWLTNHIFTVDQKMGQYALKNPTSN